MTQITLPREVVEQLVGALEMPCDRWSTVQFKIAADAITAGRAALANAEPAQDALIKYRHINGDVWFQQAASDPIPVWAVDVQSAQPVARPLRDSVAECPTHWMPLPKEPE